MTTLLASVIPAAVAALDNVNSIVSPSAVVSDAGSVKTNVFVADVERT
jgi:prephenate dehydrogenase